MQQLLDWSREDIKGSKSIKEMPEFIDKCSLLEIDLENIIQENFKKILFSDFVIVLKALQQIDLFNETNIRTFTRNPQKAKHCCFLYDNKLLSPETFQLVGTVEMEEISTCKLWKEFINDTLVSHKFASNRNLYYVRWINLAENLGLLECYQCMRSPLTPKVLKKFIVIPDNIPVFLKNAKLEKIIDLIFSLNTLQKESDDVLTDYLTLTEPEIDLFSQFIRENKHTILRFRSIRETLIEFRQSLAPKILEKNETFSEAELKQVINIQRYVRSQKREEIHMKFFENKPPKSFLFFPEIAWQKTLYLIDEISERYEIVNPFKMNHFSVVRNLQSIIKNGYFFGHQTLKHRGINFEGNALGLEDASDLDTICFTPGRIDPAGLWNKGVAKKYVPKENLCAIICDLSTLSYPGTNQFFKLIDLFCAKFQNSAQITEELSIGIVHDPKHICLIFSVTLNRKTLKFEIKPSDVFYYGKFNEINRFCLMKLVSEIQKNPEFSNNFVNYLNQLDESTIKKILIISGQFMTLFAEYNVHSHLALNDIRIQEIRIFCHNIKYDLSALNAAEYQQFLQHFADSQWDAEVLLRCKSDLNENENINPESDFLVGDFCRNSDFTQKDELLFDSNHYVETRSLVLNKRDSISYIEKHGFFEEKNKAPSKQSPVSDEEKAACNSENLNQNNVF